MRYQIGAGGFPVAGYLIPCGTVIDDVQLTDGWSKLLNARGIMPPVNCQALDQQTYDWMVKQYGVNRVGLWPIPGQ
jgi:hypothetical protein